MSGSSYCHPPWVSSVSPCSCLVCLWGGAFPKCSPVEMPPRGPTTVLLTMLLLDARSMLGHDSHPAKTAVGPTDFCFSRVPSEVIKTLPLAVTYVCPSRQPAKTFSSRPIFGSLTELCRDIPISHPLHGYLSALPNVGGWGGFPS